MGGMTGMGAMSGMGSMNGMGQMNGMGGMSGMNGMSQMRNNFMRGNFGMCRPNGSGYFYSGPPKSGVSVQNNILFLFIHDNQCIIIFY